MQIWDAEFFCLKKKTTDGVQDFNLTLTSPAAAGHQSFSVSDHTYLIFNNRGWYEVSLYCHKLPQNSTSNPVHGRLTVNIKHMARKKMRSYFRISFRLILLRSLFYTKTEKQLHFEFCTELNLKRKPLAPGAVRSWPFSSLWSHTYGRYIIQTPEHAENRSLWIHLSPFLVGESAQHLLNNCDRNYDNICTRWR